MAYIQSHQELARHPKTRRAARLLHISIPQMIGHLHILWHWALDYAQDGELGRYESAEIADAAMWDGDAGEFFKALIDAGFIDVFCGEKSILYDWKRIGGDCIARTAKDSPRRIWRRIQSAVAPRVFARDSHTCSYCGAKTNLTVDHIMPLSLGGSNRDSNLTTACRSCNSANGPKLPKDWVRG